MILNSEDMILNRLEVLTGLTEFAEQQMAKGSPYTANWADPISITKWYKTIDLLRNSLPAEVLEKFNEERKRKQHRPECQCILCTE